MKIRSGWKPATVSKLMVCIAPLLIVMLFLTGIATAQDTLTSLRDETLSYFKPLRGNILAIKDGISRSDLGAKSGVKAGMKFSVLRQGAPFLHPVTKEPLGKMETQIGTVLVKEVNPDGAVLTVLKGDVREGDSIRISESTGIMLFYQDRNVDWALADSYFHMLKDSGRFVIKDTPLDSADDAAIISEAKKLNANIALILRAEGTGKNSGLRQKLVWVEDSITILDKKINVDIAFARDIKFGSEQLPTQTTSGGEALLSIEVPSNSSLITLGDVDGNGKQEVIISAGSYIKIYAPGESLQTLYEFKTPVSDDHLRLEALDINADGRDEIIITSMRDGEIVSYIYSLKGSGFSKLWEDKLFLRKFNAGLIVQGYNKADGFDGPVFNLLYDNGIFKKGIALKIPQGVNIYDFIQIDDPDGNSILAYDDSGYLNLYDKTGLRVWRSNEGYGNFLNTYRKAAPTVVIDNGDWSVKDRLFIKNKEAIAIKRIPLARMAKGLGYKKSQVKALWWTGLSMEEKILIDDVSGGILDYAISGDKLMVLSKTLFGIVPKKIFKGENPFVNMLYIYSLTGK